MRPVTSWPGQLSAWIWSGKPKPHQNDAIVKLDNRMAPDLSMRDRNDSEIYRIQLLPMQQDNRGVEGGVSVPPLILQCLHLQYN